MLTLYALDFVALMLLFAFSFPKEGVSMILCRQPGVAAHPMIFPQTTYKNVWPPDGGGFAFV